MSDKEQLINLLTKAKANFKEELIDDIEHGVYVKSTVQINNSNNPLYTSMTPGYYDFYSIWYFDEYDNLLMIGHWE